MQSEPPQAPAALNGRLSSSPLRRAPIHTGMNREISPRSGTNFRQYENLTPLRRFRLLHPRPAVPLYVRVRAREKSGNRACIAAETVV
jgi:hypothetical protein